MISFIVTSLIFHTVLSATISEPNSYDTIVVGLGASGVAAASKLAEAGKRVLGLEAQDRIGGRVKTVPFGNGVVEVGAEWIHGTVNSVTYDLAVINNVSIKSEGLNYVVIRSNGTFVDTDLVNELTDLALDVQAHPPPDPEPLGKFITAKLMEYIKNKYPYVYEDKEFTDNFFKYLDLVVDSEEASNSWYDVTTAKTFRNLQGKLDMSWHKYGYYTLFEILLNTYQNRPGHPTLDIKINTEVINIRWPQDPNEKVKVSTKDGAVYTADNVIVTVSVGILKEKHAFFTPPVPQIKQTAIDNVAFGIISKIILCFDPVFWMKDMVYLGFLWSTEDRLQVALEDEWTLSIQGFTVSMGAENCIALWNNGESSITVETLSEEEVKTKAMAVLRKFAGKTMNITEPIGMIRTMWHSNPFVRGAYTYDNLDMPKHPNAREDLAAPLIDSAGQPRVLFAGEATSKIHHSTVHGAVETGYREAKRILSLSE